MTVGLVMYIEAKLKMGQELKARFRIKDLTRLGADASKPKVWKIKCTTPKVKKVMGEGQHIRILGRPKALRLIYIGKRFYPVSMTNLVISNITRKKGYRSIYTTATFLRRRECVDTFNK